MTQKFESLGESIQTELLLLSDNERYLFLARLLRDTMMRLRLDKDEFANVIEMITDVLGSTLLDIPEGNDRLNHIEVTFNRLNTWHKILVTFWELTHFVKNYEKSRILTKKQGDSIKLVAKRINNSGQLLTKEVTQLNAEEATLMGIIN
jgi:hypothetical protein